MQDNDDGRGVASEHMLSHSRRDLVKAGAAGLMLPAIGAAVNPLQAAPPADTLSRDPYKVALVHVAADPRFRIEPGVEHFIELMRAAKAGGASLIACGELWLPGYPRDLNFQSDWKVRHWADYVANSITIGDARWEAIRGGARAIGIHVAFGFSEIAGNRAYMSQALIDDHGKVVLLRRKVRPSGSERNFWSDDAMAPNLKVAGTRLGRISILECYDHLRPQSVFPVMAQLPNLHIAAWPLLPRTTPDVQWWERTEVGYTAAAYASLTSGAVTLVPSVGCSAVFEKGVMVAQVEPESSEPLLFHTVLPDDSWTGRTADPKGEYSYGIARLVIRNHPGPLVRDAEHERLNLVPLPAGPGRSAS